MVYEKLFYYVIGHFFVIYIDCVTCVWAGWPRVPVGGNPVNNVTHDYLFYAGFLLNYVCACEFYLYIVLCVL